MSEVTVSQLASDVGTTVDRLLKQLSDAGIAKLDKSLDSLGKKHSSTAAQLTALSAQLDEIAEVLARADLGIIQQKVNDAQALSKQIQREISQMETRVRANEEWVESVNVFRRQVNERLNEIQNPASAAPVLQ